MILNIFSGETLTTTHWILFKYKECQSLNKLASAQKIKNSYDKKVNSKITFSLLDFLNPPGLPRILT